MTSAEMMKALARPFALGDLKFLPKNVKGNRALAMPYISARAVQDRLDEVVGFENWMDEYDILPDASVVCRLRVKINGDWVTKIDVGSPSEQPDAGDRLKASFSDALKRAAVKFGVGRFLYRLPPTWCDYDPQTKQFTKTPQLPAWALPGGDGQQRQPAANAAPQQQTQQRPPQQQPQQVSPAEVGTAIAGCKTLVEVEALVLATKQNLQQGRLPEQSIGQLQRVVATRVESLVMACESEAAAKEASTIYQRGVLGFLGKESQHHNLVLSAFNALKAKLVAQQQQHDVADPFNR